MWFQLMPEEFKQSAAAQRSSRGSNSNSRSTTPPSSTGYYSSAHLLVNMERQRSGGGGPLLPLQRSARLDGLAQQHATILAQQGSLHHSVHSLPELKEKLQANNVGENAQRGESIREMHETAMQQQGVTARCDDDTKNENGAHQQSSSRVLVDNILSPRFTEIGIGTAVSSKDGKLYMVQLYRGGHWV
jgi:uncharacterized protein YkwD